MDHNGCFTDVNIGWPGRVHDTRVLHNSELFSKAESGNLFPQQTVLIGGVRIPIVIIADAAYPLKPWLMKPYINTGSLSAQQKRFNFRLSHTRVVVEHAFGLLKGRWRCLQTRLVVDVPRVPERVAYYIMFVNSMVRSLVVSGWKVMMSMTLPQTQVQVLPALVVVVAKYELH